MCERKKSIGYKISIAINIILTIALICLGITMFLDANEEQEEEYIKMWAFEDLNHMQQSCANLSDAIQITFLATDPDKQVEIEVEIYDTGNKKIAVIKKGYEDIIFDSYEYNYKIKILKSEYPTAKSAKITSYRYTVYKKRNSK